MNWVFAFAAWTCILLWGVAAQRTSGCISALHILSNYSSWKIPNRNIHRHIASLERTYAIQSFFDWIYILILPCLSATSSYCRTVKGGCRSAHSVKASHAFLYYTQTTEAVIPRQQRHCDYSSYCILVASC